MPGSVTGVYGPVTIGEDFEFSGVLQLDSGNPLVGVTGAELVFAPVVGETPANLRFTATGPFTITNSGIGAYTFIPSAGDLVKLLVGNWLMQVVATLSSGQVRYSTPMPLRVMAAL